MPLSGGRQKGVGEEKSGFYQAMAPVQGDMQQEPQWKYVASGQLVMTCPVVTVSLWAACEGT